MLQLDLIFILLCLSCTCSLYLLAPRVLSLSLVGGGGYQYSRNLTDHRWHHLRHWPRLLQTEELQRPHRHGVTHRHALLTGNCSPFFWMFNKREVRRFMQQCSDFHWWFIGAVAGMVKLYVCVNFKALQIGIMFAGCLSFPCEHVHLDSIMNWFEFVDFMKRFKQMSNRMKWWQIS